MQSTAVGSQSSHSGSHYLRLDCAVQCITLEVQIPSIDGDEGVAEMRELKLLSHFRGPLHSTYHRLRQWHSVHALRHDLKDLCAILWVYTLLSLVAGLINRYLTEFARVAACLHMLLDM